MLLDDFVPAAHFRETHTIWTPAPPERVYRALRLVTPAETPLVGWLMGLRTLPTQLAGRRRARFASERPLMDQFVGAGFRVLAEAPNEEIVLGRIAQFWKLSGGQAARINGGAEFLAFAVPGYAKAAMNFAVHPDHGGARLSTETRVWATDPVARRQFARYWSVIHLGSAAIRRSWLKAITRRAEGLPETS
jgi:hypothetical protein